MRKASRVEERPATFSGGRAPARFVGSDGPLAYSPEIDVLRAVAVAAVCCSHWMPVPYQFGLPLGGFGVQLFFVISGYLITAILVRARTHDDWSSSLRRFYLRRALRLLPAFYCVLLIAALLDLSMVRESFWWHAFYLSNIWFALHGWIGQVQHFWSLAVEEQFYLVWPWLMLRARREQLWPIVAAAVCLGVVTRRVVIMVPDAHMLEVLPLGNLDFFGIGAAAALAAAGLAPSWFTPTWLLMFALCAGVPAGLIRAAAAHDSVLAPIAGALARLAYDAALGSAVWMAGARAGAPGLTALRWGPLVHVGRISYGIYLVHWFAAGVVMAALARLGLSDALAPLVLLPLFAAMTLVLAETLWWTVERPFNAMKARWPYVP